MSSRRSDVDGRTVMRCECNWPEQAAKDDCFPVSFDQEMQEFSIELKPQGSAVLRFCPWCGGELPASNRATRFTEATKHDIESAQLAAASCNTIDDLQSLFGEADQTLLSSGEDTGWVKQHHYTEAWETVQLIATEKADGHLIIKIGPKPLKL